MDRTIKFKGYLTFEDSLVIQKSLRKQYTFLSRGFLTLAIMGVTAFLLTRMEISLVYAVLLMLFLGSFMAIGFRVMQAFAVRSQKEAYVEACARRTGTLDIREIKISRDQKTTRLEWNRFDRMMERKGVVAVVKDKNYLGFASYMFGSETDWEAARKIIARVFG